MIELPFVPQPYPDEILGSWLARTYLLNGNGAWRVLLEASGFGRRIEKPLFDMPDYDSRVHNLLDHLGSSYEDALLNLTTYPYWASFESSNTEITKGGTKVKALVSKGKVISQLRRVGQQFYLSMSMKPYFCPLCLISDSSNMGEPFWHRSHQLPSVYYCPTHHIPLQNKCTACGISNISGGKRLMPLPSLICSCGYDYRRMTKSSFTSNEIYKSLTKVSIDALENKEQNWSADNVKAYFSNLILEKLGPKQGAIFSKIKHDFNVKEISASGYLIDPLGYSGQAPYRRSPTTFRAPDFCIILASMDIDFRDAAKGFKSTPQQKKSLSTQKTVVGIPESVEVALTELLKRRTQNPKSPLARHKMLYWYLRIKSVDSLKILNPNIHLRPIPTIENDRLLIENLLSKQSKSQYNNTVAIVRATIRDSAWLIDQNLRKSIESKAYKDGEQQQKNDLIHKKLKQKLQEILANEDRPERITLIRLGAHVGFSASQIIEFVRKYPDLSQDVKNINEDKERRQLIWASNELKKEGIILTAKKIHRKAGLPFSPSSSSIVKQLLLNK